MKFDVIIGSGVVTSKENDAGANFGQTFDVVDRKENSVLVRLHGDKNYSEFDLSEVTIYWKE
jgi:hypothetical protein